MATKTEEFLTGTGTTISFTTQYINESDIKVRVDGGSPLTFIGTTGTPSTGQYKIAANSTTITFGDNQNGKSLHIYSETDVSTPTVTFTPGSSIKAADLNSIETLVRHGIKESRNEIVTHDIRDGQVTSDKILDGTIVDADINASAAIANTKIADGLLKSTITVNSANIVDGSIVNDDISNSANINGSKIADASIPVVKIASGTLPSNTKVTSANIEDGTIVNADVNSSAAIAGTKITPDFGSQNMSITGNITVSGTVDGRNVSVDGTKLDTIETNAKDDQTAAEIKVLLQSDKLTDSEIETGTLDNRYFTETESDARYFRQDSSETIASGNTWTGSDAFVATTAAIDARIIDLLDDTGGFVPLANETSFPAANPDINNGNGTVVSVKAVSTNLTPSSGTVTIANGAGTGNTVTITGVTGVIPSGFGMILETTSTLHTYAFHRLQAKATEVNAVAANIGNVIACGQNLTDIENFADLYQISTTAPTTRADGTALTVGDLWFDSSANQVMMVYDGSSGDGFSAITPNASTIQAINTVAGHVTFSEDLGLVTEAINTGSGNNSINTVGANIAAVNTVAADLTEATSEIDTVATNITNVNNVGNNISNVNAVHANASNINSAVSNATNITTVAGSISNVNNVGGSIANVNTVAGKATEIGRLGTADAVADMNTLGTSAIVSDLDTCADISSNITTVAGISSNVTTVANNNANVTAVAGNATNINTVATNVTDVNNFTDRYQISSSAPTQRSDGSALQDGDLWFNTTTNGMEARDGSAGDGFTPIQPSATTVQNIANVTGFVTFVEDNGLITDAINTGSGNNSINTVGSNITNVNTVAGSIANVNSVGNNISNVNSVANNATNINAVQANASNINAAVSNATNINAAVSNASNITTVAGSNTNINTVAASIGDINRYAAEYVIQSGTPSSPSAGDLWYNTTSNVLNYYTGGTFVGISPGIAGVINDANPALANHLDCNNKNLTEVGTVSGDNLQIDFGTIS